MRIPLTWLKEFVNLPKDQKSLVDKLTMAGHMLDKTDTVNGNKIIDLELRGNRADCYSIIGIAREVAALFGSQVKYPKASISIKKVKSLPKISLNIKTPLVKRVVMTEIKNVKITDSPKWLKDRLKEYGIDSINNIVDLTNYVMIETGEPMHAFDLDKVGNNLEIRLAKKGEKMTAFQDKVVTLTSEDLVWSKGGSILSIAGAIGGKNHSISTDTKNVLLEAASYDRANIRRSIHRHKLLTDAGIRHEKDLDPNIVDGAVVRFLDLFNKNEWGKVSKVMSDYYPSPVKSWKISTTYDYIYSLSGLEISPIKIQSILKLLGFNISKSDSKGFEVLVPTHRTDVKLEEDLVEEIVRIYGYENIPTQTLSLEIPEVSTPDYINQEQNIKEVMLSIGFDEVISSSFVIEKNLNLNKPMSDTKVTPVKVSNRPSPDAEVLRMSLFANMFEMVQKILNERGSEAYLFEVGKVYSKNKSEYKESRKLGIIYCQKKDAEFVYFKGYLESLFEKLNINGITFDAIDSKEGLLTNSYEVSCNKKTVGYGGQLDNVFYIEIDLDSILDKERPTKANLWPKYPPQIEDITLQIPAKTKIGSVADLFKSVSNLITNIELKDIYKDSYTFRVWYQDENKTLNDSEVEKIREKAINTLKRNFGVDIK